MKLPEFIKVEQRENTTAWVKLLAALIAIVLALLVSMLLVRIAGGSGKDAFVSLIQGGFGDRVAILDTLLKATPIILTGLAAAIAYTGKFWNIGGEGQFFMGAIGGYFAYLLFHDVWLPAQIGLIVLFGCLGGALWAGVAAFLKAFFSVDEIISTVMLNYIAVNILSLLLSGVWKDDISIYRQTPMVSELVRWPPLWGGARLTIGFFVAILCAGVIAYIIKRTPLGYEIRAIGLNDLAAKFKGINIPKTWMKIMLLSGAAAGLAAVTEVFGVRYRLSMDLSTGYGYNGIIVAMLADLNPLAIIPVGIFFAGLLNGSIRMQIITKVPSVLISAVQAIVLIFLLVSQMLAKYRISFNFKSKDEVETAEI